VCKYIYIQYWCIDGKYIIDVARLRNGGKRALDKEYCVYILMFFFKLVEASSLAKD
jgi:hypothetical protein